MADLEALSRRRPEGMFQEYVSSGEVVEQNGESYLNIEDEKVAELEFKYAPPMSRDATMVEFKTGSGAIRKGWSISSDPNKLNKLVLISLREAVDDPTFPSKAIKEVSDIPNRVLNFPNFRTLRATWAELTPKVSYNSREEFKAWLDSAEQITTKAVSDEEILQGRSIGNQIRREAGPSLTTMAGNFIGAMGAYAKDGFRNVNKEEHAVRQAICNGCEFWDAKARMGAGKCMKCGCSGAKLWMASSECPIKKWGKIPAGVPAGVPAEPQQA